MASLPLAPNLQSIKRQSSDECIADGLQARQQGLLHQVLGLAGAAGVAPGLGEQRPVGGHVHPRMMAERGDWPRGLG